MRLIVVNKCLEKLFDTILLGTLREKIGKSIIIAKPHARFHVQYEHTTFCSVRIVELSGMSIFFFQRATIYS
jgi:hypothetical protein